MILDNLREVKDFDEIKSGRVGQKLKPFAKTPAQTNRYVVTMVPATHRNSVSIWEDVWGLWENKPFQNSVQEQQWQKVHDIKQEATNDNQIDTKY